MDKETELYVINILRQGTTPWAGRTECLNRNRRQRKVGKFQNGKDKLLWERECDGCGKWYLLKDGFLEVDHIIEIGPFKGDWTDFIKRMYCGQDNLQALCISCHSRKTSKFNSRLRFQRKEKEESFQDALDAL